MLYGAELVGKASANRVSDERIVGSNSDASFSRVGSTAHLNANKN